MKNLHLSNRLTVDASSKGSHCHLDYFFSLDSKEMELSLVPLEERVLG
jgi:hypothetical protein